MALKYLLILITCSTRQLIATRGKRKTGLIKPHIWTKNWYRRGEI